MSIVHWWLCGVVTLMASRASLRWMLPEAQPPAPSPGALLDRILLPAVWVALVLEAAEVMVAVVWWAIGAWRRRAQLLCAEENGRGDVPTRAALLVPLDALRALEPMDALEALEALEELEPQRDEEQELEEARQVQSLRMRAGRRRHDRRSSMSVAARAASVQRRRRNRSVEAPGKAPEVSAASEPNTNTNLTERADSGIASQHEEVDHPDVHSELDSGIDEEIDVAADIDSELDFGVGEEIHHAAYSKCSVVQGQESEDILDTQSDNTLDEMADGMHCCKLVRSVSEEYSEIGSEIDLVVTPKQKPNVISQNISRKSKSPSAPDAVDDILPWLVPDSTSVKEFATSEYEATSDAESLNEIDNELSELEKKMNSITKSEIFLMEGVKTIDEADISSAQADDIPSPPLSLKVIRSHTTTSRTYQTSPPAETP